MGAYLVECYWPGVTRRSADDAADRARRLERDIECLAAVLVPLDETVLFVFDARSADDLRSAAAVAGIPADRITACVALGDGDGW